MGEGSRAKFWPKIKTLSLRKNYLVLTKKKCNRTINGGIRVTLNMAIAHMSVLWWPSTNVHLLPATENIIFLTNFIKTLQR